MATNRKPQTHDKDDVFGLDAAAAAFAAAKAELLHFWQVGHRSLKKRAHYPFGRNTLKATEAAALRWNKEKIRQARAFARRCSEKELEQRIAEAYNSSYPPHWTILVTIYQVTNKAKRQSIWNSCRRLGLSRQELADRIRAENLPRDIRASGSGRKLALPSSPEEAKLRLRQAADRLLRLQQACGECLADLPADARRVLTRSVKVLTDLKLALSPETKPRRVPRSKA